MNNMTDLKITDEEIKEFLRSAIETAGECILEGLL